MLVSTHPGWFPTTGLSFCLGLVWEQGPFITWWSGKPMVILQGVPDISRVSDTCCTELDDQGLMELKIREWISLEGTSGCTLSNSSTHARIPTAVCPGPCPGTFWRPPKEGVSATSGADSDVITLCKQTICNLGVNTYSRAEGLLPQNALVIGLHQSTWHLPLVPKELGWLLQSCQKQGSGLFHTDVIGKTKQMAAATQALFQSHFPWSYPYFRTSPTEPH